MDYSLIYKQYFPFWDKLKKEDQQFLCDNSFLEHFEKEQPVQMIK